MKSRRSLYVLIPLVIGIWGLIAWKVLSFSKEDPDYTLEYQPSPASVQAESVSYDLKLNYRDPFLRGRISTGNDEKSTNNPRIRGISEKEVKSLFSEDKKPPLSYLGMITEKSRKTAIVIYKNRNLLLQNGDEFEGLTISGMYPDSLVIKKADNTYSYERKK